MNKKFLLFLLAMVIAILYLFSVEKVIYSKLTTLNNSIQSIYVKTFVVVNGAINKYLNQLDYIEQLRQSNELNLKYKLLYEKKTNELHELNKNIKIKLDDDSDYKKVRVIAYADFNDHSKVVLNDNITDEDKISSLITFDGYSAGIVLNKDDKTVAYLNQNKKCNYTVYIGKNNAPGITSGITEDGNLVIKYVPIWKEIEVGDEVITSSMDSIFPYGIKVGKITEIKVYENTKEVLAKPYANTFGNRDYFIYNKDINSSRLP